MATVEKLGGNWVIVRAAETSVADEYGHFSRTDVSESRLFWTGDRWAPQYGLAKQFLAKQDAEAYLTELGSEID